MFLLFYGFIVITSVSQVGLVFGVPGDVQDKTEEDVRYRVSMVTGVGSTGVG
jgi:hypothetical protein